MGRPVVSCFVIPHWSKEFPPSFPEAGESLGGAQTMPRGSALRMAWQLFAGARE